MAAQHCAILLLMPFTGSVPSLLVVVFTGNMPILNLLLLLFSLSVDGDESDKKWYQNSDEEDDSPHTTSITSPTGLTNSQWQAPAPKKDCTPQDRRPTNDSNLHSNSSSSHQTSTPAGKKSSGIPRRNGNSHTDGNVLSRHPSDGTVKKQKPVVAPKSQRQRSKSAGLITRKPRANESSSTSRASVPQPSPQHSAPTATENETSLTSLESYSSNSSRVSKSSSASKTSSSSQASKGVPLTHDYAILEPPGGAPDHDYAVLDPEYNEEFYGK